MMGQEVLHVTRVADLAYTSTDYYQDHHTALHQPASPAGGQAAVSAVPSAASAAFSAPTMHTELLGGGAAH